MLLAAASYAAQHLGAIASVGESALNIGQLFGDQGDQTDAARKAKAELIRAGALLGDVTMIRYMLDRHQLAGAAAERALYDPIEKEVAAAQPAAYAKARALGGIPYVHEDGQEEIARALELGMTFSAPGLGHPTGHGHYDRTDPVTLRMVAELAAPKAGPSTGGTGLATAGSVQLAGAPVPTGGALAFLVLAGLALAVFRGSAR